MHTPERLVVQPGGSRHLIGRYGSVGHTVVGPTVRDGAIVTRSSRVATSCRWGGPTGRRRARTGSSAGTTRPASGSRSGPTRGSASSSRPGSGSARRDSDGDLEVAEEPADDRRLAFGVRACDLHAIAIQDRVFSTGASSTATTPRGAMARSSSPSTASSLAARASASGWGLGHGPSRASTSR